MGFIKLLNDYKPTEAKDNMAFISISFISHLCANEQPARPLAKQNYTSN